MTCPTCGLPGYKDESAPAAPLTPQPGEQLYRLTINGIGYAAAKELAEDFAGGSMVWSDGKAYPSRGDWPCEIVPLTSASSAPAAPIIDTARNSSANSPRGE